MGFCRAVLGMRPSLLLVFAVAIATPVTAAPITWQDAGVIHGVFDRNGNVLPGLTIGTPWSLQITFDPASPGRSTGGLGVSGCNTFDAGATVFTFGGFTYRASSGQVFTNSALPGTNCTAPTGMIQFNFYRQWTQEPGAWDLNLGALLPAYYDAVHSDGSLPTDPTFNPIQGVFAGLFWHDVTGNRDFQFYSGFTPSLAAQPTPVPEPGTLVLLGTGLAYAGRRRRRSVLAASMKASFTKPTA